MPHISAFECSGKEVRRTPDQQHPNLDRVSTWQHQPQQQSCSPTQTVRRQQNIRLRKITPNQDLLLQTDSSFVSTLAGRNSATSSVRTTAKAARPDTFSISAQRNPSCVSFLQTTANKWAKEAFTKSQSLQHAWPTTVSSSSGPPSAGKQNTDSSRTLSPRPPLQTHSSR
jgi:hypothetical protein